MPGLILHRPSAVGAFWMEKSGCTILKNMFFLLNTGRLFSDPLQIHATSSANRKIRFFKGKDKLDRSASFIAVRGPVSRFLSFYWDKIYSVGPYSMPQLRTQIAGWADVVPSAISRAPDLSLEGHRANLATVLDGLEVGLSNHQKQVDPHCQRQSAMITSAGMEDLFMLPLEQLSTRLPEAAIKRCPALPDALAAMPRLNESQKAYAADVLLTPTLRARIEEIYDADMALYQRLL